MNAGKCAVITGGAGLLGRAMATAFAGQGFDIVLADIDQGRLETAAAEVRVLGVEVLACRTDVADQAAMDRLADAAFDRFGRVNRLCLNAGLAIFKPFETLSRAEWDQVLGVQMGGVLNGVHAFIPRLIAQGETEEGLNLDRHVLIVSSMSGVGRADLRIRNAPYVMAKFATVGLAEVMAPAMEEHGIGVSVLCPGMTVDDPDAARGRDWPTLSAAWYKDNLLDAQQVAAEVLAGIADGRLHIFPHRAGRKEVVDRHERLMAAFDQAERTSPNTDTNAG